MRSIFHLAVLLVVCLVGIGLYRGWFSFSKPAPEADGNKVDVNLSLDKNKMEADLHKAEQKVKEKVNQWQSSAPAQPAK